MTLRHWDKAEAIAERIRDQGNPGGVADQIRGAALMGRGELDQAISLYRDEARRPDAPPGAAMALALALSTARKPDEAADVLKSAVAKTPGNPDALVLLGWVQVDRGQPEDAKNYFTLAVERQPGSPAGYLALARLAMREHRADEAIGALRSGLRAMPDHPALRFELANSLQTAKRYEEAIAEYEGMLRRDPDSLLAANNLAILLADHRRDAASLERATKLAAMLVDSSLAYFLDTRGWISYRRGEYAAATALLESAAAEAPERAAIRYHLGMVYLAKHDTAKAAAALKAAASLNPDPDLAADIGKALNGAGR